REKLTTVFSDAPGPNLRSHRNVPVCRSYAVPRLQPYYHVTIMSAPKPSPPPNDSPLTRTLTKPYDPASSDHAKPITSVTAVSTFTTPPIASLPYSAVAGPFTSSSRSACGRFTSYSALWLKNPVDRVGTPSSRYR